MCIYDPSKTTLIIAQKGTWHDFPVSCGMPVTAFVLNTKEVVAALAAMPRAAPMDHGDCFKLRLSDHFKAGYSTVELNCG